jgi:flagellar biosynthesis protein FlhF
MKILSFTGTTPAEALKKAQIECGENALVLDTKQIKKNLVEIKVAVEEDMPPPQNAAKKKAMKSYQSDDDVLLNLSEAAKQISKIANVSTAFAPPKEESKSELPTTASYEKKEQTAASSSTQSDKEMKQIKDEIFKLGDKMKILQSMVWEDKKGARDHLNIPPEFAEIYKCSKQSDMNLEHLNSIMRQTLELMPQKMRESSESIKRYFQVLLRKMVPTRVESNINRGQKKVMMFVGPTGVGKTTTLAKLAARYSYMLQKKYKVGIITLDTFRIGAVEQLVQYAKMMRLPVEDVVDISEFEGALNALNYCDIILIDTVGSSPYDKQKIEKLSSFIQKSHLSIDVNLVMSATTKYDDMKNVYENFSFLDIDTLIFTKFDESKSFGNIFSLVLDIKKPISYYSVGQEVPDDIQCATSEFLVDCILDGFTRGKK